MRRNLKNQRPEDIIGKRVFVYRNSQKESYSVRFQGLISEVNQTVVLRDCQFKVSEPGRLRVIKNQRKNVHAGVLCTRSHSIPVGLDKIAVTYRPKEHHTFVTKEIGQPIYEARYVLLSSEGCFAYLDADS
jgi:hypothetical protein